MNRVEILICVILLLPISLFGQQRHDKNAFIFSMGVEHFNHLVSITYNVDSTDNHVVCEEQYLAHYVEHLDEYSILDTNCFWIIESPHYIYERIMPYLNDEASMNLLKKIYPHFCVNVLLSNPNYDLYMDSDIEINNQIRYREVKHNVFLVVLAPLNVYRNYLDFFTGDRIPGMYYPDYKKSKIFSDKNARGIYVKILIPVGNDK